MLNRIGGDMLTCPKLTLMQRIKRFFFKIRRLFFALRFNKKSWKETCFPEGHEADLLKEFVRLIHKYKVKGSTQGLLELADFISHSDGSSRKGIYNQWLTRIASADMSWVELKAQAQAYRLLDDHYGYEKLLQAYDGLNYHFLSTKALKLEFIGYGLGDDSLNVFRKVTLQNKVLFEKVYLIESADFKRLEWFENHVRSELDKLPYLIPKIDSIFKGNKLAITYFDFLDQPLDNLTCPQYQLLTMAKDVNALKLDQLAQQAFPYNVADFTEIPIYQKSKQALQHWMQNQGMDSRKIQEYEKRILEMPRVLNHGDLHGKNTGNPNIIIDWDRVGPYPVGFDVGYILSNTLIFSCVDDWKTLEERLIKSSSFERNQLLFAINYFSLIFYIRKVGNKILPNDFKLFLEHLNKRHQNLKV